MNLFLRGVFVCLVLTLNACSTLVTVPQASPASPSDVAAAWANILASRVNDRGEVHFSALAKDPAEIEIVVRYIQETDYEQILDPIKKITYLINAYNALSMYNVIASGIPESHSGLKKLNFFVFKRFQIGKKSLSLYALENDIIRPLARELKLPEIHFALNCSARSCPELPQKPFTASNLRDELLAETRRFFAKPDNWRVDFAQKTVYLNEILRFYTEDFTPDHGRNLIEYGNKYASATAPLDFAIRFTPYDWRIANSKVPQ
jgi:hypothetical protein